MRSFIVRVYRRRGGELSGTVQAVGEAAGGAAGPPAAFASAGELLQRMSTEPRPATRGSAAVHVGKPGKPLKPGR